MSCTFALFTPGKSLIVKSLHLEQLETRTSNALAELDYRPVGISPSFTDRFADGEVEAADQT
ncbi:hypothetical protein [Mesorhizobium sp.]|uniref:hypothetical protein n=1 Tax=Mesorhizobium sp. TaxID=1871066 RepID=UPI0012242D7E|nr:hypothetical protein [Mesorhizobium sp.]TIO72335.1 MAG: hypothetical protein E5X75_33050 [Mesorhizobium sp.]